MGVSLEFGVIVNARHWRISRCPFLRQAVAVACLARGLAGCASKEPSLPASQAKHPRVETCCPQCLHESLHLLPSWLQLHFPVRCSAGLADAWPVLLPRRFIGKELLVELKTQLFFQPLHFSTLNQRLCWPEQPTSSSVRDHSTTIKNHSCHRDGYQRRRSRAEQICHPHLRRWVRIRRPPRGHPDQSDDQGNAPKSLCGEQDRALRVPRDQVCIHRTPSFAAPLPWTRRVP